MSLPVINRPIDNTAQSAYMTCPKLYELSMHKGYRTKETRQALSFGGFWHRLLETHYKSGADQGAMLEVFTKYQHEVPDTGDYRTAKRAFLDYTKYLRTWPVKEDIESTVGYLQGSPMVELSTAISSPRLPHEYAGKIDRIIKVGGLGYIEDHKTTSRFDKGYFRHFELSNQMKGYVWIARQLITDIKIVGVRINLNHCLTSKSEFHRHLVSFSDAQIEEWEANTAGWMKRIAYSIEHNDFPMHFGDNGCSTRYGRCQFFEVCSTSPSIRQKVLEQDFHIDPWDPLAYEDD